MQETKPNIIHISSQTERWETLKKELERQHITNYMLWFGETQGTPRENISKSHKRIVSYAKQKGLQEVIIMENDVMFPAIDGYEYFLKNKPTDFDIYLSATYTGSKKVTEESAKNMKIFSSLHCYIVHSRFYDTFLNLDTSKQDIDNAIGSLARQNKCKVVCCFPFAAIQGEFKSSNSGCVFNHKHFFNEINVYGWVK